METFPDKLAGTDSTSPPSWMAPVKPVVPDHELIRRIGGGSYGDVWLAHTAVGTWRAVKVVFRDRFLDSRPYEREFAGMQKFEPLSRSNEAFVDILQIGRNDAAGYFYYVMELADDATADLGGTSSASPQSNVLVGRTSYTSPQTATPDPHPATLRRDELHESPSTSPTQSRPRITRPSEAVAALSPDTFVPKTLSKVLLQRSRLPVDECLELGLTLNLGLAHLHRAGLIHRDIKPSNIIFVGGVPKLADIGLVIEQSEARSFVGTEGFVPAEGPNSAQADLYSLGKVLYEAGMGKDRKDFPEPYTQLAEAPDSEQLLEFNAILLKACAANRGDRYQSAEEMNVDLALLQSGGSVRQQRRTARQLCFVRRAGALVTALAAVVALGWWWQARQTATVRELASKNRSLADRANISASLARQNEEAARANLYAADINLAFQALKDDNLRLARSLLDAHVPKPGEPDLRGFEWRYLWQNTRSEELATLPGHGTTSRVLAMAPDAGQIAVGGLETGNIRLLDVASREVVATLADTNAIMSLTYSPDGQVLVSGSASDVRLWDPRSFSELRRLTNAAAPAVFSPDGLFLLTGRGPWRRDAWDHPRELLVWDARTWTILNSATFPVSGVPSGSRDLYLQLAFGTDSGQVAVLVGGTTRLLNCPELEEKLVLSEDLPDYSTWRPFLTLSPDNRTLALPSPTGFGVRLWDLIENRELRRFYGHSDHIFSAKFTPDGERLATASPDQTVKLWQVATGELLHTFRGQADEVIEVAFSGDGTWLASLGITESVVKLWDVRARPRSEVLPPELWPQGFAPGGRFVVMEPRPSRQTVSLDPADLKLDPVPHPRFGHEFPIANKLHSISPDGRYHGLWNPEEGILEARDRRDGSLICTVPNRTPWFSFDARGRLLATAATNLVGESGVAIWDLPTGDLKWEPGAYNGYFSLFSTATGDYVVTQKDEAMQVALVQEERLIPVLNLTVPLYNSSAAISPDGRLLATGIGDITIRSLPDGEIVGVLKGHTRKSVHLAFSPDSRTIGSIADDHTTRLWHVATQRELLRFPAAAEDRDTFQIEFSPDGRALACYRHDGTNAVTSLYFAPSLAEIAVIEGGDYAAAAGDNAATWFHVASELLRQNRPDEALDACVRSQTLAEARDEVKWWLEPMLIPLRSEILRQL